MTYYSLDPEKLIKILIVGAVFRANPERVIHYDIILISVKDMEDMTLDELDELEDEEEERILEQYRAERMAQIRNIQA